MQKLRLDRVYQIGTVEHIHLLMKQKICFSHNYFT